MHRFRNVLFLTLMACAETVSESGSDGGETDAHPDSPGAADAAAPDATAGPDGPLGWIGSACGGPQDCPFAEGMCLTEGFPGGLCTRECSRLCPDRAGYPVTFCVDGRPFGFDEGLCVSRCDPGGCPGGYQCAARNRYGEPATVASVCVPAPSPGPCTADDELVDIAYPDFGKLWIPAEAQCGGAFPLVVMLHGINPNMNQTPSLGGGRRLEIAVRAFIDAGLVEPLLLAEPVQTQNAASSTGLYSPAEFDPATHLDRVTTELERRGITVASLSYTGHSGSGCDASNGLYLVLDRLGELVPAYAPALRLWGTEDICYGGTYNWQKPVDTLGGSATVIVNMTTTGGDPTAFEDGLLPGATALPCASVLYSSCLRHPVQAWCSYRTRASAGIDHNNNPFFFVREAFPQVFSTDGVLPCR